jgi:uncharacterized protein
MLSPKITLVEDKVIHGRGLVATDFIRKGEFISRLGPDRPTYSIEEVLTWTPEERDALLLYGYQCDEHTIVVEAEPDRYMNHSCDANTWWEDDNTMTARRDIMPGEEITYDYATTEITIPYEMHCRCGSANCRHLVTNLDYLNPEWQAQYGDHLPTHTRRAIEAAKHAQERE